MKIVKYLMALLVISLGYSSCIKEDAPALGSHGSPFIKIMEAPSKDIYFDPFSTVQNVELFNLRREETNNAAMSQPVTVGLTVIEDSVAAYNEANGTEFEVMPDSIYTLIGTGVTKTGNNISMTLAADVIGNQFTIALNGSKWNVSHKYALYFAISDSAGKRIRSGMSELFVTIQVKNAFDAQYAVTGYFVHPSSPREIARDKVISTLGISRCRAEHSDLAGYYLDFDISESGALINYAPAGGTPALPSSGFMTVDNPTADANYPGAPYTSDVYNNTYDASAQTFWMHYGYGSGSTSQTGFSREIYEKWVRK